MSISLSFRTEEKTREQLDRIAESLDRNRNWVVNDAIEAYIDIHRWQLEHIEQGIRDTKAGRTFSSTEARARVIKHMAKAKTAE